MMAVESKIFSRCSGAMIAIWSDFGDATRTKKGLRIYEKVICLAEAGSALFHFASTADDGP